MYFVRTRSNQLLVLSSSLSVPGQPGKFKVGRVTDTSIELTWEPAYTKEGIVNYELLYKPVKFGSLVRTSHSLLITLSAGQTL